jgi:Carboxypeptidase regulatory-like domain/TonB dependent receptor
MTPGKKHLGALLLAAATILGLATFTLVAPPAAHAQADLGSISGIVTDASGAVVPRAQVTVTNVENGAIRTSETGANGGYSVSQLVPGKYTVSISGPGFETATQAVTVSVGSQNAVSAKLAVAGGKTEVVVAADDFSSVQLEKAEISAVIDTEQIQALPTLDRNPYNLVAYSGSLSSDATAASRGVGFNISGARSTSVDILLDGAENTDLYAVGVGQTVPLDATSEIRIVTSNSGAEYGRGSGAVNVSTKSGTNGFHGSVYEFNRISTLASAGYNNNYIHAMNPDITNKPRYTHNQFGYSVGGPIKKDKLFFFSSTEWTRIRSSQNIVAVVPTPELIAMSAPNMQDFFGAYGKLAHPINGATYNASSSALKSVFGNDVVKIGLQQANLPADPNNPVKDCTDPRIAATAVCSAPQLFGESIYQAPQDSGGGAPVDQWITFNRADWTINSTTSMFVRYIQQSSVNPPGYINYSPYDGYNTNQTQYNHNLAVSLTKAFTPTLASATKLLATRFNNAQPLAEKPVSPTLYVNGSSAVTLGGNYINFPGYSQLTPGNAIPFGGPQNFIQVGEDLAWTKGKHQFAFGGLFLFIKDNRTFGAYEEAVDALVQSGHNNALANFVSGGLGFLQVAVDPQQKYPCVLDKTTGLYNQTPDCTINLPVASPNFSRSNRYQDGAAYVADTYKATPRFTLNYGLRWEVYGPQHSQKPGYDSNFFFGSGSNEFDQIRNGQLMTRATSPNGRLWHLNLKDFAPKIGFAWDPVGDGKTSIRGGYGISFERNFNNVTFNVIQNPPNYAVLSFTPADNGKQNIPISTNNFAQFGTSTGTKLLPNVTLRAVDPNIAPAYASNYSLSVERQFAGTTASVSYVGTRGVHNYSIANINRSFAGINYLGDPAPNLDLSNRLNLQYSSINFRGADGDSYYNGLTGEIRSSNLHQTGLTIRGDYTYSHSIDNTSSTFTDGYSNNDNLGYLDPFNKGLDRGNSDFDQTHRVAAAIIWAVPYAKNLSGASKMLLDNWTFATTFDAQTGTPFSMFDCWFAVTVCPRASYVNPQPRQRTRNMNDISSTYGPNTFSYMSMPQYFDENGVVLLSNFNEQLNPYVNAYYGGDLAGPADYAAGSDTPICGGLYNSNCRFVTGMTGRNAFRGPGNWNQNVGVTKDFKIRERWVIQFKAEFINVYNHANTLLNLGGSNDVSSYSDVLAYKGGINGSSSVPANRNSEFSLHLQF